MNNMFWRAYHGLKVHDLRSTRGEPTWATFGTINTVTSLVRRYRPSHVLLAWDKGRSKYRSEIFAEYKGTRSDKQRDYDVDFQLFLTRDIIEKMGLFQYHEQDVEADDIMAESVYRFSRENDMLIVSSDHDVRQLISERVDVLKPSLNVTRAKEEYYKLNDIVNYWGTTPDRLPEMWALQGDTSDNIPGARGVGPKSAISLFKQYGSLDAILESRDKKILGQEEVVRRAYELIRLKEGIAKCDFSLTDLEFKPNDKDDVVLTATLSRYSFDSTLQKLKSECLWEEISTIGRKLTSD